MPKTAARKKARRRPARPTLASLQRRVDRIQERLEDLEDLRTLESAIAENAGKPLIPWEQAKKELELD